MSTGTRGKNNYDSVALNEKWGKNVGWSMQIANVRYLNLKKMALELEIDDKVNRLFHWMQKGW